MRSPWSVWLALIVLVGARRVREAQVLNLAEEEAVEDDEHASSEKTEIPGMFTPIADDSPFAKDNILNKPAEKSGDLAYKWMVQEGHDAHPRKGHLPQKVKGLKYTAGQFAAAWMRKNLKIKKITEIKEIEYPSDLFKQKEWAYDDKGFNLMLPCYNEWKYTRATPVHTYSALTHGKQGGDFIWALWIKTEDDTPESKTTWIPLIVVADEIEDEPGLLSNGISYMFAVVTSSELDRILKEKIESKGHTVNDVAMRPQPEQAKSHAERNLFIADALQMAIKVSGILLQ